MGFKKTFGIFVLCLMTCVVLLGCQGKKLSLTSNDWEYKSGGFVYHFGKDGKGTYTIGKNKIMKFKYVDNKTSVSITYEGDTSDMTLDYRIEKNQLIIVDSFGSDTVYVKK